MLGRANRAAAPVAVVASEPSDFFSSCWADILVVLLVINRTDRTAKSGEMANATSVVLLPYVCMICWLCGRSCLRLPLGSVLAGSFCEM